MEEREWNTRLEAALTGSQDGCRYEAARFQRASEGGILPPVELALLPK